MEGKEFAYERAEDLSRDWSTVRFRFAVQAAAVEPCRPFKIVLQAIPLLPKFDRETEFLKVTLQDILKKLALEVVCVFCRLL